MNLKQMREQHAEAIGKAKALVESEGSTKDDLAQADALIGEAVEIEQQIAEAEENEKAAAERDRKLAERNAWAEKSRGTLPGMAKGQGHEFDNNADPDDPAPGEHARKFGNTGMEVKGGFVGKTVEGRFTKFCTTAEWEGNKKLRFVSTPEYKNAMSDYLRTGFETKTLTEGVDSEGGYLVPPDMAAEIIRRLPGLAIVEERARLVNTTRDKVQIPRVAAASTDATMYSSAVSFTMVGETPSESTGDTEPSFEQIEADVYTAKLETSLSRNMVADSAFDVEGLLVDEFRRAGTLGKDDKHLTGTGAGEPLGIVNDGDITPILTGASGAMAADGLQTLIHALPAQYRNGAELVFSRDAVSDLAKIKDGNGRYMLDAMNGGLSEGAPAQILGVPYRITDFLADVAGSAKVGFYGNLGFYWAINRLQFSVQVLREVKARQNQNVYVGFLRFGGAVSVPEAFRIHTVTA